MKEPGRAVGERRIPYGDGPGLPVRVARGSGGTALVLAHGAGTSMAHPAMRAMESALARRGVTVVTFDFPYRARGGGAPDRMPVLVDAYRTVVAAVRDDVPPRLFVGGRSLGGRVASHCVAEGLGATGLVFLAFPLHAPGKPGTERAAHLAKIHAPMLFVQGTRDAFARPDLLQQVLATLPTATLHPIPDADHGFAVPKRTGKTPTTITEEIATAVATFMTATHATR
jgi:predicted alpha/beta-hydrolase family hydrolase